MKSKKKINMANPCISGCFTEFSESDEKNIELYFEILSYMKIN